MNREAAGYPLAGVARRVVHHYRGSNREAFRSALKNKPIEVRLRDWYPASSPHR